MPTNFSTFAMQWINVRLISLLAMLGLIHVSTLSGDDLEKPIRQILEDRCIDCHNAELKNGGMNLAALTADYDPARDKDAWVKVDSVISKGIMPPEDEESLTDDRRVAVADWFEKQFVRPGGIQHAGPNHPRRLTREELQNTLEDILRVDIREDVTNSRLHVIPDTIIEKFFAAGIHGKSGFSNDAVTLSQESVDIQTTARCFALVLSLIDSNKSAREYIFGGETLPADLSLEGARAIIDKFAQSAFRRPVTTDELAALVTVYEKMAAKRSKLDAIKSSFLAVLLSPSFLYRFEEPANGQVEVVGNELAVRLAYFLWSSPPDATLMDLVAKGELRQPEVLKQQVRRMLADPKRIALAENFGGEWFDYKKLRQQSAVNKRSDKMAGFYRTQFEEALLFFDSVIRYDQSIYSLVDAEWAYSNRHQSGIYRLSTAPKTFEVEDPLPPISIHFRSNDRSVTQGNYEYKHSPLTLVKLTDSNRGGLLTLGPTMSVTSTPNRTSPIRRGVWVMERILGEHFEPPVDVPDLEETQKKAQTQKLNLSHNEILKLHSSQDGCVSCHKYIDPIGFGLEAFDQLGISRSITEANPAGEKLQWTPKETPKAFADRSWSLKKPLETGTETKIFFQWKVGRHRLDVRNVRLQAGEVTLTDAHAGFTGSSTRNNVWFFKIPADAPKTGWKLTANVKGDGGNDSNGTITIAETQ